MIIGNGEKKLALLGAGGIASEISAYIISEHGKDPDYPNTGILKFVHDGYYTENNQDTFPLTTFNPDTHALLIAIGTSKERHDAIKQLPSNTTYFTYIHNSVYNFSNSDNIGRGSFIAPNCVITTNVKIGEHSHLNIATVIGHDCSIGDFFTTAPGAKLSGKCTIGNVVYIGTNAVIKQKLTISDNTIVGMCAGVTRDITESGIYTGIPARKNKIYHFYKESS